MPALAEAVHDQLMSRLREMIGSLPPLQVGDVALVSPMLRGTGGYLLIGAEMIDPR